MKKGYDMWQAYSNSKLANVVFTKELSRRLLGTAVTTNAVYPGLVRTRWSRDTGVGGKVFAAFLAPFSKSARRGARPVVKAASDPSLERVSGQYFESLKVAKVVPVAEDQELATRLWDESVRLTKPPKPPSP